MSWVVEVSGGVDLLVLVQPRASRTKVVCEHDGRLKIALMAPPIDGAANAALIEFLSETLGVRKSAVTIAEGASSRRKRVRVEGVTAAVVSALT